MSKRLSILASFLIGAVGALAQGRFVEERIDALRAEGAGFAPVRLLRQAPPAPAADRLWSDALRAATVLELDRRAVRELLRMPQERITLEVPGPDGAILLDLVRAEPLAPGFLVRTSGTGAAAEVPSGLHYRGAVRGAPGSLAAVSLFPDAIMGLIGEAAGDRVLGPLEGDARGLHVLYRTDDLRVQRGHACGTVDEGPLMDPEDYRPRPGLKSMRCVRLYWESAYDLYQSKGSVANVTAYLTGLFNQMATLYDNDGVQVQLQELYVWDTPSPYNASSSGGRLNEFRSYRTSFNGDLAHLIDLGGYGGIAVVNSLCSSPSQRMAYSGIYTSYSTVPTYSWSVNVVTHETGHNLGSRHTHACIWNGDNTAIDGCGPAAGYSEGSCPQGPLPPSSVGGTIMSYCHLTSSTIKFANGFGPQPKALIISRVNSASCLAACGTSCDPPEPLTAGNLTATSALLGWANVGAVSYTLRWRIQGGGSWNTVAGLASSTYSLTGLTQETTYEFQVMSVCSSGSSAYSASKLFTTPEPCTDPYEPNNTLGAATVIAVPSTINALISPAGDNDYCRFTTSATGTLYISLSNLAGDYDLYLLDDGGDVLASSLNAGTANEYITLPDAPAGTYHVRVHGWGGAYDPTVCYRLTLEMMIAQCPAPQGLAASGITYESALLSWSSVGAASGYILRWKPSAGSAWTVVNGIGTASWTLSGLAPLTSYDVQVRSLCAGGAQGGESPYSATHSFTTLEAPCEVAPRSVVAARAFLEGAYDAGTGLMLDSLRRLGLVPLAEPYTAMGHAVAGPLSTTAQVLQAGGSDAVVDWVLVELRDGSAPHAVLEARAGLLQRDGDVVAPDGESPLGFCTEAGSYRVAIRHRNHLGTMTGAAVALGASPTTVDLGAAATPAYGTEARKAMGSAMALWAGNVDPDGVLRYTGQGNDRDPILIAIGGAVPTATATGYLRADVNMDGTVKYVGQGNDRDPILLNVGGSVPTATRAEQLP